MTAPVPCVRKCAMMGLITLQMVVINFVLLPKANRASMCITYVLQYVNNTLLYYSMNLHVNGCTNCKDGIT